MRRLSVSFLVLVLLVAMTGGMASAEWWDDRYPSPKAIGVGSAESPGQILNTLTPELKFQIVGEISYIDLYDAQDSKLTLAEQHSNYRSPVLVARVTSSSLQIPAGILQPGKSYYWYVESTHSPGSKSENSKTSQKLYFSTTKDAK